MSLDNQNTIQLIFRGTEYTFPADIVQYVQVLNFTTYLIDKLLNKARAKIKKKGVLEDSDFIPELTNAATSYVKMLCDKGIYTESVDTYISDNEGYEAFISANKAGWQAKCDFLADEMQGYLGRQQIAQQSALSNVTGSGYSVISSSLVTLAAASIAEQSLVNKQMKQAEQQYKTALDYIEMDEEQNRIARENEYVKKQYAPAIEKIIVRFCCCLMDKYISDLISADLFSADTLNYVDYVTSSNILKNINLINKIDDIFNQAFGKCPFNIDIYLELVKQNMFIQEDIDCLKALGQYDNFLLKLNTEYMCLPSDGTLKMKLADREVYINALSLCNSVSSMKYKQEIASSIYDKIVRSYRAFNETKNGGRLKKLAREIVEKQKNELDDFTDDRIMRLSETVVRSCATDDDFSVLINDCGYTDLLNTISPNEKEIFSSRLQIDKYCINVLSKEVSLYLEKFKKQVEDNTKAEERRIAAENKIKNRIRLIFIPIVSILIAIPFVIQIVSGITYDNRVRDYIRNELNVTDFTSVKYYSFAAYDIWIYVNSKTEIHKAYYAGIKGWEIPIPKPSCVIPNNNHGMVITSDYKYILRLGLPEVSPYSPQPWVWAYAIVLVIVCYVLSKKLFKIYSSRLHSKYMKKSNNQEFDKRV